MRHKLIITIKKQAKWILYFLALLFICLSFQHINDMLKLEKQIKSLLRIQNNLTAPPPTLAQWHLFGAITKMLDLPISNLPLTLQGISFLKNNSDENSVIINDNNSNQAKSYKNGDQLPYGATVKAILSNQVNIEHNGQFERLILPTTNLEEYHNAEKPLPS